jgi:hypothetical protein
LDSTEGDVSVEMDMGEEKVWSMFNFDYMLNVCEHLLN